MGIAAILFNSTEPFNQIDNDGPMWNLVKTGQVVSKKKTFKDNMVLYKYPETRANTPRDKILNVTKMLYYFNHTL